MRQVHPSAGNVANIVDAYSAPLGERQGRSWVGLCMVASIDGSTVVDGLSTGLSSQNDMAMLHRLRELADVIIVGAGTVRGEGYGPPKTPGQRVAVVTGSGNVDTTMPLFSSGAGFLVTTTSAVVDDASIDVIRSGDETVDLRGAIARFGEIHPSPDFVQAEGGAQLNASLLDADLIDEINLTTSPLCVGGSGPRLTSGANDHSRRYELAQMLIDEQSFVFSRWVRRPETSP